MREAMVIKFNDDGKTIKVSWQYYGSMISIGSIAGTTIGVRHKDRKKVLQIAEELKEIVLQKKAEPAKEIEEIKKKPVKKKEVKKLEIKPRRKK